MNEKGSLKLKPQNTLQYACKLQAQIACHLKFVKVQIAVYYIYHLYREGDE